MKRIVVAGAMVVVFLIAMGASLSMSRNVKAAGEDSGLTSDPSRSAAPAPLLPVLPSPSVQLPAPDARQSGSPQNQAADPVEMAGNWKGPGGSMNVTGSEGVALTFDDGPSPAWTPQVLKLLRRYQVQATFCVVGTEVEANPELLREIAADGHTLCNHSWHHEMDLGTRSVDEIRTNMKRTNEAIRKLVPNARIDYYRQPGGNWTKRVVRVAKELGMAPLHWTVDPSDWDGSASAGHIENEVIGKTGHGSIVLMHDGGGDRRRTYDALDPILDDLLNRFELIPLP